MIRLPTREPKISVKHHENTQAESPAPKPRPSAPDVKPGTPVARILDHLAPALDAHEAIHAEIADLKRRSDPAAVEQEIATAEAEYAAEMAPLGPSEKILRQMEHEQAHKDRIAGLKAEGARRHQAQYRVKQQTDTLIDQAQFTLRRSVGQAVAAELAPTKQAAVAAIHAALDVIDPAVALADEIRPHTHGVVEGIEGLTNLREHLHTSLWRASHLAGLVPPNASPPQYIKQSRAEWRKKAGR